LLKSDLIKLLEPLPNDAEIEYDFVKEIADKIKRKHLICELCGKPVVGKTGLHNHKLQKHRD